MRATIAPTFCSMPESVLERWKLIRRFTENWEGISLADVSDGEVASLPANHVTSEYPVSFLEWFRFCDALIAAGCRFFEDDPPVAMAIPGQDAVSLMLSGEGGCYWGVSYGDLRSDDPPVHQFILRTEREPDIFMDLGMECESITEFALERLAFNVFPRRWIRTDSATEARLQQLQSGLLCHAKLGGLRIFESPSVAVFATRDGTLIIGMDKSLARSRIPAIVEEILREAWGDDWG